MSTLSSRERLKRVFRCQPVDRMPVRLWGVDPMFPGGDVSWRPLFEMTDQFELDLYREWFPNEQEREPPVVAVSSELRDAARPQLQERVTTIHAPAGPISQVYLYPRAGGPGYVTKPYIASIEDAHRWLSIPQPPPSFGIESYFEVERKTGNRALLMAVLSEAMYSIQSMMGSETFGYWLMDERELLREMVDRAYEGIEARTKYLLRHGIGDVYGWVGPELCIPPLASPRDFREFVLPYDREICDLVHDAGKLVWVHCHGDMYPVLEGFIEMGVDCLNPMEPPPIGRLTLAQAKERVDSRMCLEGGVEDGDLLDRAPEEIARIVEETVAMGKPGGGFILCPTSSPTTVPSLTPGHITNYRAFVETGIRMASYE
jgi:hypothetical protein